MSLRKRKQSQSNHERWLVSYADFITLLFAFFVVLYASSQADKHKMMRLAAAIGAAFSELGVMSGQTIGPPISEQSGSPSEEELARMALAKQAALDAGAERLAELRRELEKTLSAEIQKRSVSIHQGPEGLVVSLREMGFYDSGSADIRRDALPALERIVDVLRPQRCRLRIEGHTDNVPIHTQQFSSNWELSTARATSMIRLLVTVYGIEPNRLSAAGYGEFHPIADNASEEGRRLNRRLDIVILSASAPQPETTNSGTPSKIGEVPVSPSR